MKSYNNQQVPTCETYYSVRDIVIGVPHHHWLKYLQSRECIHQLIHRHEHQRISRTQRTVLCSIDKELQLLHWRPRADRLHWRCSKSQHSTCVNICLQKAWKEYRIPQNILLQQFKARSAIKLLHFQISITSMIETLVGTTHFVNAFALGAAVPWLKKQHQMWMHTQLHMKKKLETVQNELKAATWVRIKDACIHSWNVDVPECHHSVPHHQG